MSFLPQLEHIVRYWISIHTSTHRLSKGFNDTLIFIRLFIILLVTTGTSFEQFYGLNVSIRWTRRIKNILMISSMVNFMTPLLVCPDRAALANSLLLF